MSHLIYTSPNPNETWFISFTKSNMSSSIVLSSYGFVWQCSLSITLFSASKQILESPSMTSFNNFVIISAHHMLFASATLLETFVSIFVPTTIILPSQSLTTMATQLNLSTLISYSTTCIPFYQCHKIANQQTANLI